MGKKRVQCAGAKALRAVVQPQAPSQSAVAKRLGVTPQAVSSWIGGRTRPSRDVAAKLEAIFGIPLSSWVDDVATEEPTVLPEAG